MASSTELLAAIVAAPNDDAPRLVYADWLLERGDPRGVQIIAQCTLARCERAGDRTSMAYKVASLAAPAHGMERGFTTELVVRPDEPEAPFPASFVPGLPLRRVQIDVGERDVVRFADLDRVRALAETSPIADLELVGAYGRMRFDARALLAAVDRGFPPRAAIWGNGQVFPVLFTWDHVTYLELTDRSPPFDGLELKLPPNLRHFRMSAFAVTPRLVRQLPRLSRLEIFEASNEAAREVFAEWSFERLEALTLVTHAEQPAAGVRRAFPRAIADACVDARALRGLKHLAVSFALDERMPLQSLETLEIEGGARGDVVARLGPHLHRLSVSETDLVFDLATAPPPALSTLTFVDCTINGVRARRVAAAEPLARLAALSFVGCRHNTEPMRGILHSPTLASIPRITVTGSLSAESRWRNDAWKPPGTS